MRRAHPDHGGDTEVAAQLNLAMAMLRAPAAISHEPSELVLPRGREWQALEAAATAIGTIVLSDAEVGYLCVALRIPGDDAAMLDLVLRDRTVLFTLETQAMNAPDLSTIVARIQRHVGPV